jgi:hypothetical protein
MPTEFFPRGFVASGSGELKHAKDIKISYKNNAALVHTNAASPAGYVLGTYEGTASYTSPIGSEGQDLDSLKKTKKGEAIQLRFKVPGKTITISGVSTGVDFDMPVDKEITESLEFIGEIDFS